MSFEHAPANETTAVQALQDVVARLEALAVPPLGPPPGWGQPGSTPSTVSRDETVSAGRLAETGALRGAELKPVTVLREAEPWCLRCGGLGHHGAAADDFFSWVRRYGWQAAVQWVLLETAWGLIAWRGSRDDPDGRVVCLLVEDEDLPAAFAEVLERIKTGRTRPQPPVSEVVTWEHWSPPAAAAGTMEPALPPGPSCAGRVTRTDWPPADFPERRDAP